MYILACVRVNPIYIYIYMYIQCTHVGPFPRVKLCGPLVQLQYTLRLAAPRGIQPRDADLYI